MSTVPQVLTMLDAMTHAEIAATITDLYHGAPTFAPAQKDRETLLHILKAWMEAGAVPPAALALACAKTIAARIVAPPPAPPVPVAPAIPVFAPAPIAPASVAPQPEPAPAPAPAEPTPAPIVAPAETPAKPAPALPTSPGMVNARSLFTDQPDAIVDRIPADLQVMHYASADAPAIDPDYAFDGINLASTLRAMSCTPAMNIWTYGPRGTGKTEFCRQIAARLGREFHRVNFHRAIDAEDLLGSLGLENGNTKFVRGPVAIGVSTPGAVVLLDEFTYCPAAHAASLNPILERNGAGVRLSRTGERLMVAPGVMIFAADNTGGHGSTSNEYTGRAPMGSDTLDRFAYFLSFDFLPAETERRVLRAMVKGACGVKPDNALARSVIKLIGVARARADIGELEGAPSLRRAVAFCTALVQGAIPSEAYISCVVNPAPEDSQETLKQIFAATWDHGTPAPAVDPSANPFVSSEA